MWQELFKHEKSTHVDKDLLYVLDPNQEQVQNPFSAALAEVSEHIYVKRAEIELKRMVRQLMVMTGGGIYSPLMLSTLGLPYPISIVLWVTVALLEDVPEHQIEGFIEKRTHDSVKLLQSLHEYRQFLRDWWQNSVTRIPAPDLPTSLKFPVGHPLPPRLYRRHPLKSKSDYYYPVNAYYALLYEEREQELIRLLTDLGATRIAIQPLSTETSPETPLLHPPEKIPVPLAVVPRVFEYAGCPLSSIHFDVSQYEWLAYEPSWQTVVEARMKNSCLSASLELSLDISNTITTLLDGIENLSEQLTSIQTANVGMLRERNLKQRFVQVEFKVG